ncbi:MAG: hypothetical protein IPK08_15810 [Bacteroidetes bacterium]|nr:hypothetical protein [Bacteroidota bacterium]
MIEAVDELSSKKQSAEDGYGAISSKAEKAQSEWNQLNAMISTNQYKYNSLNNEYKNYKINCRLLMKI